MFVKWVLFWTKIGAKRPRDTDVTSYYTLTIMKIGESVNSCSINCYITLETSISWKCNKINSYTGNKWDHVIKLVITLEKSDVMW